MFLAGSRIGPYQIVGRLGAGGMGEVYRARDPRLDRSVAVKVLTSSRGSTPEELERFEREARAIARVSHPNICTVYDVGQDAGVPFLVMELLEGETLAERVLRGPVPIDAALAIATQIAEALDELHSKGVVHRDLKPSNVMLTASGVKLLDFGLAKLRDGEYEDKVEKATKSLHLTGQGTVLGTLPYMAPEQVEGRPADARTDTFALGVVLYEMITGRAPFQGTSQASLTAAILTHEPPPLSSRIPTTPASLDRVVKKCLSKDPDERWQSAKDLASALRWSADDSTAHHPATGPTVSRGRRRTVTALAAVAVAAALIAAAVWAVGSGTTWRCRIRSHSSIHSSDVPCGNTHGRPIHSRRRLDRLQRGVGSRSVRALHDATRQRRIQASGRSRREAAWRIVERRARISPWATWCVEIAESGSRHACSASPLLEVALGSSSTTSSQQIGSLEGAISRLCGAGRWSSLSGPRSMASTGSDTYASRRMASDWPSSKGLGGMRRENKWRRR